MPPFYRKEDTKINEHLSMALSSRGKRKSVVVIGEGESATNNISKGVTYF